MRKALSQRGLISEAKGRALATGLPVPSFVSTLLGAPSFVAALLGALSFEGTLLDTSDGKAEFVATLPLCQAAPLVPVLEQRIPAFFWWTCVTVDRGDKSSIIFSGLSI
mmetsp:Transcript_7716/g.16134  ORF Transcript_7716/g.16134 Transcript_7716/m.16134 type:complete len:109 (+) Transcript_7716:206-532(+)